MKKLDAGKRFRKFREDNFLTQADLAGMLGIARETVSRIENGGTPKMRVLRTFLVVEKRQIETVGR